ncbi:MAG: aldo/keto reductase [Alphaproteobacteria bacterium]
MNRDFCGKLGLGTVQFGLDYGISNANGQTSLTDVKEIINLAINHNVTMIDTAHLYGNSEEVLGQAMPENSNLDIVTKTIPIRKESLSPDDIDMVEDGFNLSIDRLRTGSVYGLLLHHADDLKSHQGDLLYKLLMKLREVQRVKKIGVSIYDAEQIDFVLDHFPIDLVQIPMNIFDQRLLDSGHIQKLKSHGVEIHVRSAFLQGLVFMDMKDLPNTLQGFAPFLDRFHGYVRDMKTTAAAAALSFLMRQSAIDKVICGVNSPKQFKMLIQDVSALPEIDNELFSSLAVNDPVLVNPAHWET